jgi:hypothetical protein
MLDLRLPQLRRRAAAAAVAEPSPRSTAANRLLAVTSLALVCALAGALYLLQACWPSAALWHAAMRRAPRPAVNVGGLSPAPALERLLAAAPAEALSRPECAPLQARCLHIVSTGRSGSTALLDFLNQLPGVLLLGENDGALLALQVIGWL